MSGMEISTHKRGELIHHFLQYSSGGGVLDCKAPVRGITRLSFLATPKKAENGIPVK
jgi:hypothetical protein